MPLANKVIFTRFEVEQRKSSTPKELKKIASKYKKIPSWQYLDPEQALDKAFEEAGKQDLILVTGSFFLTGKLREKWYPEKKILDRRSSF